MDIAYFCFKLAKSLNSYVYLPIKSCFKNFANLDSLKMFFHELTMNSDLCKLKDLDDESLIQALRRRYSSSQIYTNCGLLLISINPYKDIENYNSKIASYYRNKIKHPEPHLYSIVESCIQEEPIYGESTIIIGGESGSGKTECARTILKYLNIGSMDNLDLILESFGNCKTKYNDNSSRFGKLIRINDNKASISIFLLEKTRVTGYKENERNFHIFYYILAAKNISLRNDFINFDAKMGVRDLHDNVSVKGSFSDEACKNIKDKPLDLTFSNIGSMTKTYQEIRKSFEIIGVDFSFVENVLLGILYIGSIEIKNNSIVKNLYFEKTLELLMLDGNDVEDFLLRKILKINNEEIKKPYSQNESLVMRNSLARQIYMQLFNYIVFRVNRYLSGISTETKNLNILDIFGFENFEQNGLDQFCINWCNEKLHDLYVRETFEFQKDILISEDICDKKIVDEIRDKCNMRPSSLSAIEKDVGLADLILEESFINGNAKNLGQKIKNVLNLKITPNNKLIFEHFNGEVEYDLDDFLMKNKEKCILSPHILMKLDKEIDRQFLASKHMNEKGESEKLKFSQDSRDQSSQSENFTSKTFDNLKNERPFKQNPKDDATESFTLRNGDNVIGHFKENLDYLFAIIKKTRIKYIKCIKPNNMKLPMQFDENIVYLQLKSSGVLDSICLSRFLYPHSFEIEEFSAKYPFYDFSNSNLVIKGKTKVFLNNDALNELELKKTHLVTELANNIKLFSKICGQKLKRIKKGDRGKKYLNVFRSSSIAKKIRAANNMRKSKYLEDDKPTNSSNKDHSQKLCNNERSKNDLKYSETNNTDLNATGSSELQTKLDNIKLLSADQKTDIKDNGPEDKKSEIKAEAGNKLDKKAIFNRLAKMKSSIDKYIKKTIYETSTKEIEDKIKDLSFKTETGILMERHKVESNKAEPAETSYESYKLKKLKKDRRLYFSLINKLKNEMIADISKVDKFNKESSRREGEKETELVKIENQMLKEIINSLKDELDLVKSSITSKNTNNEIFLDRLGDEKSEAKIIRSEFLKSNKNYKSFVGDGRKTSVYNVFGFLMHAYIENSPLYSTTVYSKNEILSLAHTIYDILFLIDQNEIEANFKICIDEIDKRLLDFQENISKATFILSNLIELRSLFQEKYNQMKLQEKSIDKSAIFKEESGNLESQIFKNYEFILKELELSIKNLFEQICTLQKEGISDLLPFSVLEHQKIQDFKTKPKFKLFAPPTISSLVEHLEYFYDLSLYFYLPSSFVLSSTSYVLSHIDQICFNSLLIRKKFLTFEKCYQIKYNLAELEKFCFNIGFRDGFMNLLNISEAINVSCAIARIDAGMYDRADPDSRSDNLPEEQSLNEILTSTFLNAPQINSLCLLFEKAILKKLPNDKSLKKFIDEPCVVFPKLNKLTPVACLENPSYLPSKCISNIYKCIE